MLMWGLTVDLQVASGWGLVTKTTNHQSCSFQPSDLQEREVGGRLSSITQPVI